MALPHAHPLDIISVKPLGDALAETQSHSLLKTEKFQLMRVVLVAGETMPEHHLHGEVSIHCLEGRVSVLLDQRDIPLEPAQLLVLLPNQRHAVHAHSNASLLVTMLLHQQGPPVPDDQQGTPSPQTPSAG